MYNNAGGTQSVEGVQEDRIGALSDGLAATKKGSDLGKKKWEKSRQQSGRHAGEEFGETMVTVEKEACCLGGAIWRQRLGVENTLKSSFFSVPKKGRSGVSAISVLANFEGGS